MANLQRYFLELAYRGTNFHGWQKQPGMKTVQSTLESALATILRHEVELTGCGRTDTGVHASHFFAHFDSEAEIPDTLLHKLNSLAGSDFGFFSLYRVSSQAHARFDAISRRYRYRMHFRQNPFKVGLSYRCRFTDLDRQKMQEAAAALTEFTDFASFCKTHSSAKTTLCKVTDAHWKFGEDGWDFVISADRFLRGMVRLVTGALLDVGRGKIELEVFRQTISEGGRFQHAASVPAEGLYLEQVTYPEGLLQGH